MPCLFSEGTPTTELSICFHYQQVKTTPQKLGHIIESQNHLQGPKDRSRGAVFFRRGIGSQPLPFASMKIQRMLEMIGIPPV